VTIAGVIYTCSLGEYHDGDHVEFGAQPRNGGLDLEWRLTWTAEEWEESHRAVKRGPTTV